jgi:formate-dependent nitrite reductase membrane component NrfD
MSKKDKKKEKISDALTEGIWELILTIVVGGLGFIICLGVSRLFSFKMDELDIDSFVLIGIAGLAVIVGVFALIKTLIKRAKNKSQKSLEDLNES